VQRAASILDVSSAKVSGLARYWELKRAGRAMPLWSDIDPAEIKALLPHLMVTRYERDPFRVRYVIVGTWVVQYGGADFTGRYLDELEFASEVDTDWQELHREVATQAVPILGRFRFLSESGLEREYEAAILPVADETGSFVERGLCIEDFPGGVSVVPDENTIALKPRTILRPGTEPVGAAVRLEPIGGADPDLRRCLEETRLATEDLLGIGKRYFRLVAGGKSLAYGGLEACGAHALLRSIVVEGKARGHGYGRTLVSGLLAEAKKLGLKDAYLLTESAAPFFAKLDFIPCARESAPPEIVASRQFAELCPASAKLMRREIG
jgi:N-acetylglutamate synthase-like GNAT family acetyltransferase